MFPAVRERHTPSRLTAGECQPTVFQYTMSYGATGSRYGGYRWGSATPLASNDERTHGTEPEPRPDVVSPEEAYGSGLKLATNTDVRAGRAEYPFDLVVDERGALETVSGVQFLIQGVAVKFVSAANEITGQVWDVNTQADLELAIANIATNDDRVLNVRNVSIRQSPRSPDSIIVKMEVLAERAAHEAVFAVGRAATPA